MLEFVCRVCYDVFQELGERTQVKGVDVVHSMCLKSQNRAVESDILCRSPHSIANEHLSMALLLFLVTVDVRNDFSSQAVRASVTIGRALNTNCSVLTMAIACYFAKHKAATNTTQLPTKLLGHDVC